MNIKIFAVSSKMNCGDGASVVTQDDGKGKADTVVLAPLIHSTLKTRFKYATNKVSPR